MRIDAHHNFWRYTPEEYGWIGEEMAALRRDFLPADLAAERAGAGLDATVAVQARQSLEETEWLLGLAARHPFIKGVVGWVALADPGAAAELARLAARPHLKGVRHVVQGEPDDRFILRDDFNRGVAALAPLGLAYDILILPRHLPHAITFVDRHPDQTFVLDHMAKPLVKAGRMEPWASQMRELARRPRVYCKVSGLVTEADFRSWTEAQLRPYFEVVLEAFGPQRLMFGSDWPVCLAASGYRRWQAVVAGWVASLSGDEQDRFWGGTAVEAYKL